MATFNDVISSLNPFKDFEISNIIPQSIQIVFEKIGDFLNGTQIFFLNIYVILIVALFFAILILIVYIPIRVYPIYLQNKQLIDKIIKMK